MRFKKSYGLLLVLLLTPVVLVGVVQSVAPPSIYVNVSSYGITVYGNNWTPYTDVTIYYDVEDAAHRVAVVEANYGGYFQTRIPTDYIPTVGTHTVIAVQGADKATAVNNVGTTAPPDDRLLNPIQNIQTKLNDVEQKVDAINAEQMLYSGNGTFYTNSIGEHTAFDVVSNKTVKVTVTYLALLSNASDYLVLRLTHYATGWSITAPVNGMRYDSNSTGYITTTIAAEEMELKCSNADGNLRIFWSITVEGSPDTSVSVTTY